MEKLLKKYGKLTTVYCVNKISKITHPGNDAGFLQNASHQVQISFLLQCFKE